MSALTPAERQKYTEWLAKAETAYNSLTTGGSVRTFVDQNGERVEYSAVNSAKLLAYINGLRAMLGLCPFIPFAVVPPACVRF